MKIMSVVKIGSYVKYYVVTKRMYDEIFVINQEKSCVAIVDMKNSTSFNIQKSSANIRRGNTSGGN